jgi:hypothetical protein
MAITYFVEQIALWNTHILKDDLSILILVNPHLSLDLPK